MDEEELKLLTQKKVAIVALTENGRLLAHRVEAQFVKADIYLPEKMIKQQVELKIPGANFQEGLRELFTSYDYLICIMATGIVVRSIASVVVDKRQDPAVLVIDEKGKFVISLLSGHIGGGNQLATELASKIKAMAVITTATDTQNVTSLDLLAKGIKGYYSNFKENTKKMNSLLAAHERVGLYQEKSWVTDIRGLIVIPRLSKLPTDLKALIVVTEKKVMLPSLPDLLVVQVVPAAFVLGVGARKDIPVESVMEAFALFCDLQGIHRRSIAQLVSLDLKKDEKGILNLASYLGCPFDTYSAADLEEAASHYPSSDFVKKTVGIGNVASASAHLASFGRVLTDRFSHNGVTLVLGELRKEE